MTTQESLQEWFGSKPIQDRASYFDYPLVCQCSIRWLTRLRQVEISQRRATACLRSTSVTSRKITYRFINLN